MNEKYSSWVDASIGITKQLVPIFERYLLRSLATGASAMGESCIDALSLSNSTIALGYLTRLEGIGLKCNFVCTSKEVADYVECLGAAPWTAEPFFVCIRSEKSETKKKISNLKEYQEVADSAVSQEVGALVQRRFYEVDSIFRHLRNALAPGCFRVSDKNLFFFDLKQDSDLLSCCALVPFSVLEDWYKLSCNMAKRKL